MKLILAIVNNDDSAEVASALTKEGYFITKLSTTGGFLMTGNTTLLIGAETDQVQAIKEIIANHCKTRKKDTPTQSSLGQGMGIGEPKVKTAVGGATVFVLSVEDFEKL